jgi:hypothetical protein
MKTRSVELCDFRLKAAHLHRRSMSCSRSCTFYRDIVKVAQVGSSCTMVTQCADSVIAALQASASGNGDVAVDADKNTISRDV